MSNTANKKCRYCERPLNGGNSERHFDTCLKRPWVYEQTKALFAKLQRQYEYVTMDIYNEARRSRGIRGFASAKFLSHAAGGWSKVENYLDLPRRDAARYERFAQAMGPLPEELRAANRADIPERDFGALNTFPAKTKRIYDWSAHAYIVVTCAEVR